MYAILYFYSNSDTISLFSYYSPQISKEGDCFEVPLAVAQLSELVKMTVEEDMLVDGEEQIVSEIPLPNVKGIVLKKVLEFCEHHCKEPLPKIARPLKSHLMNENVPQWYADFVDTEHGMLFECILVSNYMDIRPLLELSCASVAALMKCRTHVEIRELFDIVNDFTPEEEEELIKQNKWVEEP
mmetsp:Transcript_5457/g.7908  ORF Transcript_5457/g.7908 Transcript_5457/m.7908 type:complete len:184 (+) Transcript_5457:258-809(+)